MENSNVYYKTVPLYYHTEYGHVIKIGSCGDNFGDVTNIETLETNGTYGYNTLPAVGAIKTKHEIDFEPLKFNY